MAKRKQISNKIRFEVFKRDSFTCQYCGRKAPDVVLNVDHIEPVAEGGTNDILNLITSCFECNNGKRHKKLSDNSVIEKQREQIGQLNDRREQLSMILKWRNDLKTLKDEEYQKVIDYWNAEIHKFKCHLLEHGEMDLKKLVDKFGVNNVLDAIDVAFEKYNISTIEDVNMVFRKLGGILYLKNAPEYKKKISYIKGICRNKFEYYNDRLASALLNNYYENGYDLDDLIYQLKQNIFYCWKHFVNYLEDE